MYYKILHSLVSFNDIIILFLKAFFPIGFALTVFSITYNYSLNKKMVPFNLPKTFCNQKLMRIEFVEISFYLLFKN